MKKIILFDGECHFCDASVQFIIKRDPKAIFRFASLQSDIGQQLLTQYRLPKNMDSFVFIDGRRSFTQSTAVLHVAGLLTFPWSFVTIFLIIPSPIRNSLYLHSAEDSYFYK